jgi:hypothetical protein
MSIKIITTTALALSLTAGSFALAQSSATAPNNSAGSVVNPKAQQGLAGTSSDSGNLGTGASSGAIGTAPPGETSQANSGVMSPTVPGLAGNGATGATAKPSNGTNQ